jgi:multimeric flavodoxin WrbA
MNKNIKLSELLKELKLHEAFSDITNLQNMVSYLEGKKKVLLLTCSNRYTPEDTDVEYPKSTLLAMAVKKYLGDVATIIDVPSLKLFPCQGNVSRKDGNNCGVHDALLKDSSKNPSGLHRCWASLDHKEDELWKITKELFESDAVIFFTSVRWGQANMYYQKLIERLTWIENRYTTLEEGNIVRNIESGFICIGQNWNGPEVVDTQKKVHEFFGFKINDLLYWNWQYTMDETDESQKSYKKAFKSFAMTFDIYNGNETRTQSS